MCLDIGLPNQKPKITYIKTYLQMQSGWGKLTEGTNDATVRN